MVIKSFNISCFNCFRPDYTVEPVEHEMSDRKRREDRRHLRGLRRLAKAVLFDILLVKKMVRKKSKPKSYASKHNMISAKIKQAPNLVNNSLTKDLKTDSNYDSVHSSVKSSSSKTSSAPFCSSSVSSLISATSFGRDGDFDYKQTENIFSRKMLMRKSRGLNIGLCLFVVCLLVLTCWGKVCAIFCTSTMFVLVPSRVKYVKSMTRGQIGSREVDLKEQRKRLWRDC